LYNFHYFKEVGFMFYQDPYQQQVWNQMQPQQAPQQPQNYVFRNLLTPEQWNMLKENGANRNDFFTMLSPVEQAANMCTHKWQNGMFALSEPDSNGVRTCQVCHTKFRVVEPDEMTTQEVQEFANKGLDILESIKLFKGDIDPETGAFVYHMSSVFRQLPKMWANATDYVKRATGPQTGSMYQRGPTPMGIFSMIYNGFPYNGGYGYPQPMMPQAPVQPPVMGGYPQPPVAPQAPVQQPQPQVQQTVQQPANQQVVQPQVTGQQLANQAAMMMGVQPGPDGQFGWTDSMKLWMFQHPKTSLAAAAGAGVLVFVGGRWVWKKTLGGDPEFNEEDAAALSEVVEALRG
jgi:hypothetical protein